ncbi:hypothetical protein IFM89_009041 [Coptis chinensis]|uniref:Uncharacterized protein n=1 Tax=Coptis chinensis TaxID=261450 RepID=A0A835IXX0_9MAGN|nr:hypothetical protein IFM89_009041 [Coptis chinensis]
MELLEGDVVPNVLFMIKKREMRYNWYEVRVVSNIEYLVVNTKKGSRYSVDLVKLECTCIEWQPPEYLVYMELLSSDKGEGISGLDIVVHTLVLRLLDKLIQITFTHLITLRNGQKYVSVQDEATSRHQVLVQQQESPVQQQPPSPRGRAAQQQQELVQEQVAAPVQRRRR